MLLEQIQSEMIASLKSGDKLRTETLRFLISAVKKYQIDMYPPASTGSLTDEDVSKIIRKQVKTHEESIMAFQKGNRPDLVEKEEKELATLKKYLPAELTDHEIRSIVKSVVTTGQTQFGPVMGIVMKQVVGRASGDRVGKIVKEELQK